MLMNFKQFVQFIITSDKLCNFIKYNCCLVLLSGSTINLTVFVAVKIAVVGSKDTV